MNSAGPLNNRVSRNDLIVVVIGAMLILGPALVNGFPFVYPDTGTYLDSAFRGAVPVDRPCWYGLFMRISSLGGNTFWGIIIGQALLCSLYIRRTVAVLVALHAAAFALAIMVLLSLFSSVGWYAGQLMPDIFTGIGILAMFHLLSGHGSKWVRLADAAVIVFSCWVHLSNLLILPLSGCLLLTLRSGTLKKLREQRWALLVVTTIASWAGLALVNRIVDKEFYLSRGGQAFMIAHLLDSGILPAWMDEHCPEGGYRICAYRDRLPSSGNDLLWTDTISPMHLEGGWLATKPEYDRIIRSALLDPKYALWYAKAGVRSTIELIGKRTICRGLINTDYRRPTSPPYVMIEGTIRSSLPDYLSSMQNGGRGELNMSIADDLYKWFMTVILGASVVLIILPRRISKGALVRTDLTFAIGALLIDAFVCANLSTTEDRYLSRTTWILPLFVMIALIQLWSARKDQRSSDLASISSTH
ncbi:MAG: hypothetical protein IPO90_14170 [Flavobacteriales bacterium]|nr:hypothetical protein [Flavobacteriales bacterium]